MRNEETRETRPLTRTNAIGLSLVSALAAELMLRISLEVPHPLGLTVSRVLVVFLAFYCVHHFALSSLSSYKPLLRDSIYLSIITIVSVLIVQFGVVIGLSLSTYSRSINYLGGMSPDSFLFAIPFAAGALLIQTVLGLHYVLVLTLSMMIIIGIYIPHEPVLVPYILATSLVGALSISRFRSRAAYTRAGFNIVLVGLPFVIASAIMQGDATAGDLVVRIGSTLICGALCSFVAGGLTPVVEYLGGYVTDLRLIEMATLDHPLLKELSVQAPGTWNHSMVMGMMAEAAAEAIGANPVVARVGAYFHDIGKIKKPLYFVENQQGGENRHDKLSTSMSALIIRSHVKDGVELAEKHGVPRSIVDMIPQHHGTSLIEYFYEKALKDVREADGDEAEVEAGLYSYPGPKPQSREAGILMLADGIEAAARTLTEPSLDRIQGLVQKLINKVFSSGQLNECELTLNDLHAIAKSFTRVLNGIYHQRIAYFEPAEKVSEKASSKVEPEAEAGPEGGSARSAPTVESPASAKKNKGPSEEKAAREDNKEDLKRLGLEQDPRPGSRGKHSIH